MNQDQKRRDRIAQWAFDTRPVLGRFHLWLEDVEVGQVSASLRASGPDETVGSFAGGALERAFITSAAVTALGTRLFGRWGEGAGLDKAGVNRVKKDADAISAYALSEGLWYLTRNLPENHAVMVCLGEGLMPKAGETPEMGSNPLLGFGRVYARPQVARFLDRRVHSLLNEDGYTWDDFWCEVQDRGITIWGAAIDTLEGTSRFAKGEPSGPMTVLHLFDQPLHVRSPYEGYVGTMTLPRAVFDQAVHDSCFLSYRTPRKIVLEEILHTYPDLAPERVHVWTLHGPSRVTRLGDLWHEWKDLGVHLVEDGWTLPGGGEAFTDSGTYAPAFRVGTFEDGEGRRHLFLIDGYAASAEAIQAASLDPILDTVTSMTLFSSRFDAPHHREAGVMQLDPGAESFSSDLAATLDRQLGAAETAQYKESILAARDAGMPEKPFAMIDDFLPNKKWRLLALSAFMLPDPYSDLPGVEEVGENTYRVTVRAATLKNVCEVHLTLKLMKTFDESRLVFSPLLDRFYATGDYRDRPVKVSDSGRIRNELQTLCLEALDHAGGDMIRVDLDRVADSVLPADKKMLIREVLEWYKEHHPIWFRWLELAS